MLDVMLDLETMGNGPDAAIVAIGAVGMDLRNGTLGLEFYETINLESAVASGGKMDAATVSWWMQQSDAARAEFSGGDVADDVLYRFWGFLTENSDEETLRVWGNGADFDNVIMATTLSRHDFKPPWKYSNNRCFRTVRKLFQDITFDYSGTRHRAIDDARNQALHLIKICQMKQLIP